MDHGRRQRGAHRRGRPQGEVHLSRTLLCSDTALAEHGDAWRAIDPSLQFLVLPRDRHLGDEEIATVDLAVFSADLWREKREAPFMKVVLQSPNVQWLHMFSAGLDNPVFTMLMERGVVVTHSAGSSAVPIAHSVIMHVIGMCRNVRELAIAQSEARWANRDAVDVEGRRMTIVGLGGIGSEVARLAAAFGVDVTGLRRTPQGDEPCRTLPIDRLHELLPHTDDLVLTAPLTPATRGIIGATELALLPPGAHLVNVGRGELIDEPALVASLQSGHLGAAALDVFAVEPLPADSPLWAMPNVTVTPHNSGATALAAGRAGEVFLDNLRRFTSGQPLRNRGTLPTS